MTNHSRSISQSHGKLLLLSALAAATTLAAPQSTAGTPSTADDVINPSMAVMIVALVSAVCFMGFISVYLRKCTDVTAAANSAGGGPRQLARGLDPAVIESFPIFTYSTIKDLKIGKEELECAVCISEFAAAESLRLLPKCSHVFHPECIDAWLASHTTCPICRSDLKSNSESNLSDCENHTFEFCDPAVSQISIIVDEGEAKNSERVAPKKLGRCHSTGHSLVRPGESCERFTLRLPEEVRRQIMSQTLKRTRSCIMVLPRLEGGSSRGGRSDRWVFTVALPFVGRSGSVRAAKVYSEGEDIGSTHTQV